MQECKYDSLSSFVLLIVAFKLGSDRELKQILAADCELLFKEEIVVDRVTGYMTNLWGVSCIARRIASRPLEYSTGLESFLNCALSLLTTDKALIADCAIDLTRCLASLEHASSVLDGMAAVNNYCYVDILNENIFKPLSRSRPDGKWVTAASFSAINNQLSAKMPPKEDEEDDMDMESVE